MTRSGKKNKFDYLPLVIIVFFLFFGLLMVYDASSAQALLSFKDKFFFLKEQIKWVVIGLAAGIGAYLFDYRQLKNIALPLLVTVIVLLVAVFLPGIGVGAYGAHRWINLGATVLQPSELAKIALIIYLAAWLTNKETGRMIPFFVLLGLIAGLVILEPDMGTALVIIGTGISIYFLSDSDLAGFAFAVPAGLLTLVALAIRSPYRMKRILTFLDPESDPLGASYHVRQALIALGSGGLFGLGLGNSRQKYAYLPEANTDSIFAIIGEELGFIGAIVTVCLFAYLYYRCLKATLQVDDPFGRLLGLGIIAWLSVQTIINLSSMVALTPLTGVPLPFVSYGGSALVAELIGVGILCNIWRLNQKI